MEMRMKRTFLNIIAISFLVKHWPPALQAWSTKSVRDMFYISPKFPRLIDSNSLKRTISDGVTRGIFGYGCKSNGGYANVVFNETLQTQEVEISDEVYLILQQIADSIKKGTHVSEPIIGEESTASTTTSDPDLIVKKAIWEGEISLEKLYSFYINIISRIGFSGVKMNVKLEIYPTEGIFKSKLDEVRKELKKLGLSDNFTIEP
jgi:hypothetical protein